MQEDIERRTVAITLTASKLTGRVLAWTLAAVVRKVQKEIHEGKTPQGKQSVKKLMNHDGPKSSLPLDGETKLFDRVAKEFKVDYAFYPTGPEKHLLLFKAGQADAITACFSEYSRRVMENAQRQPSIKKELEQFENRAKTMPQEHERVKEVLRDER